MKNGLVYYHEVASYHLSNYKVKVNETGKRLLGWGNIRDVMPKDLDCDIVVTKFEFQSRFYFHFPRYPWCNTHRRRKWTRRHEFKSWRLGLVLFYGISTIVGYLMQKSFFLHINSSISYNSV